MASPIPTPTTPTDHAPDASGAREARAGVRGSRWLLLGAAVLCYVLFWWVGGRVGIARTSGFDGSLLLSPGAAGHVIVTAILVLAAVSLGTLLGGGVRPDAGLFAAAAGLMALANRGRPAYAVLHDAGGSSRVFLLLAVELLILFALLGAGWWTIQALRRRGRLKADAAHDGLTDVDLPANAGWSELGGHAFWMTIGVLILAQSEDKKQVLAAVAIASFAAAFFPYWKHGARPSVWYWTGPLAVGLFAYVLAFVSPPAGVGLGRPGLGGGLLAALVRPLPLDYASVGTAGALLGYWMRRASLRDREAHAAAQALPTDIRQRLEQPG